MKILLYLIPLIILTGCSKVYSIRDSLFPAPKNVYAPKPEPPAVIKPAPKPKPAPKNVFGYPSDSVTDAALEGLNWMKWDTAFTDTKGGVIRLKEAYVYKKSGKLIRTYKWPSPDAARKSTIDDYLKKVAVYEDSQTFAFTQETMKVKIIMLSESRTKIEIDYKIRPYTHSGRFGSELKSSGHIESVLLERIRENLGEKPLAKNRYR